MSKITNSKKVDIYHPLKLQIIGVFSTEEHKVNMFSIIKMIQESIKTISKEKDIMKTK